MLLDDVDSSNKTKSHLRLILTLVGVIIALVGLLFIGYFLLRNRAAAPKEAPEASSILDAQIKLPFQVLIPAYLPTSFVREKVQINTDKIGAHGEPMIELIYPTRRGGSITFFEWLPSEQGTDSLKPYCRCVCMSRGNCDFQELGFQVGALRIIAKVSAPNLVSSQEARAILDTLGPAINRQIYTSLKQVPVTFSVPPAVDVPINANGIQEMTLVVTPDGYSPAHFAVQKGVPVKLTFRQIGQVGCGDQMIFPWGDGKGTTLTLLSSDDVQTLEFTPEESGDFQYNCPHLIYRGVMTVRD
jgi:hypothetical protein